MHRQPETEQRNSQSAGIHNMSSLEILEVMNQQDQTVPLAVKSCIPLIAEIVDALVKVFEAEGHLFYVGTGTSGRLGVLDASECPPTFGVPLTMVQGIIAGGEAALTRSIEDIEDDAEQGRTDIRSRNISEKDLVIGLSSSGQAPYLIAALKAAREAGAVTAALSSHKNALIFKDCRWKLYIPSGPEIITGSTRLKSGTAQKLILNMISTAAMIRLGKVYDNLMIDLQPVNQKLRKRAVSILRSLADCSETEAAGLLTQTNMNVKEAILIKLLDIDRQHAAKLLKTHNNNLPAIMRNLKT